MNEPRTGGQKTCGARKRNPVGRAFSLANVSAVLDAGKAALRGPRAARAALAERLTAYEDWLELEHPKHPLRPALREVRRRLEASGGLSAAGGVR